MSDFLTLVLVFVLSVLVYTASLWIAAKLTGAATTFIELLVISAITGVVGLIPYGGLLSIIVLFLLLYRWAGIDPIPDAALMVLAAIGLQALMVFSLSKLLAPG